jgi:hypothetical protein
MKKRILIILMAVIVALPMFGQLNYSDLEDAFGTFSGDVAQSLPFAAAATGLTWSDASVRGFPHFGVGLSVSAVTIPKAAFDAVATDLGFSLPSELDELGVPLPGYALDARLGLPILPFDIGAKFGYMTPEMGAALEGASGIAAEYLLIGTEVRFPILKGNLLLPALSIGAGYTYLDGSVAMAASGFASTITFPEGDMDLGDPNVQFAWKTHTLDFKVQASKGFFIITPYLGAGYSYGWSQAGGGVKADISYTGTSELELESTYGIEIDEQGFLVYSDATGGSLRAFGGLSFNLFILKLDVNGQYNFNTESFGGGVNVRVQI